MMILGAGALETL